jgi:hypothetical protein
MTPEKQVSPVIRISRGERDASARATHLEAATRKFLVTTNERKQMSTKTNFKRIALVAVAALGMGVLNSIPAQAAVSGLTLTVTNGTAGLAGAVTDSSNAAKFTVSGTLTSQADSVLVTVVQRSVTTGITPKAVIRYFDSNTGTVANSTVVDTIAAFTKASSAATAQAGNGAAFSSTTHASRTDSVSAIAAGGTGFTGNGTAGTGGGAGGGFFRVGAGSGAPVYVSATFTVQMDSMTSTRVAGTYTADVILTYYTADTGAEVSTTQPLTITIAAAASASLVASPTYSTAVLSTGTADAGSTVDSVVSVLATASSTTAAVVNVVLRNASNAANAQESITATISAGTIGNGTTQGRSVVLAASAGTNLLQIKPDGTAGVATITISTPSVTFANKSMTFFAATPSTGVATKRLNTLAVSSNSGAITAVFKDSNGNVVGGDATIYAFSDALTVVSDTATACSFDATNQRHSCALTGVTNGTANITIGTASKSVVAAPVAVTVSNTNPVALKMEWNKATYAPGEKAFLKVWAVDSAGKPVAPRTITNLTASGLSTTASFSGTITVPNSDVSFALAQKSVASHGLESLEPIYLYTVYMPFSGGTVSVTATGGASLPASGQVAVTATATVTDSAASALAAVNALATTVASLKTLITTLTNLVLKIQKKVKA